VRPAAKLELKIRWRRVGKSRSTWVKTEMARTCGPRHLPRPALSVRARAVQVVFQVGVAVRRLLFVQRRIAGAESVRVLPLVGYPVVHRFRARGARRDGRGLVLPVKQVPGLMVLV